MSEQKETTITDAMVAGLNLLYDAMENNPQAMSFVWDQSESDEEEETETKENKWIH